MNVSQIMSRTLESCRSGDNLATAAGKMWDHDIGCLPVVGGNGEVVGMITDRDISMAAYTQGRRLEEILVSTTMSKRVFSCRSENSLIEAEEIMRTQKVRRLPVLDSNGLLCGVVSLNDVAREAEREVGRKGREVSAQEVSATLAAICEPRRPVALTAAAA
jgi:CBS domain-containing protein